MADDTYPIPKHGWTCFFCGENFKSVGNAQEHFGIDPDKKPGCLIKVSYGGERGLLFALRAAEEELATLYQQRADEDTHLHREIYRLQSKFSERLRIAEEAGYERGLRDAKKFPNDA